MLLRSLPYRLFSFLTFLLAVYVSCPMWGNAADTKLSTLTSAFDGILKMTEGSLKLSDYQKKLQEVETTVQKTGSLETEQ